VPPPPPPPAPTAGNGYPGADSIATAPVPPPAPAPSTSVYGAVPQQAQAPPVPQQTPGGAASTLATIVLRLPDGEPVRDEALALGVEPGDRARILGMIRNTSRIVDNYDISVQGVPAEWFTVMPPTVYLVPYGSSGTYEQEIEVHFHPPKTPDAEAKLWDLQLVAISKAHNTVAASAPVVLGIQPYEEFEPKLKPERASGRKKAKYEVTVRNKANATVTVALGLSDPDNAFAYEYHEPQLELEPGEERTTKLTVTAPKRILIGRPHETRLEVLAKTGEEGDALLAAHPISEGEIEKHSLAESGGKRKRPKGWWKRKIPFYGPRIYKPRMSQPNLYIGPNGMPHFRKPMMYGGGMQQGQMKGMQFNLNSLKPKAPGMGAAAGQVYTGPLLPTQAVFRQKPLLPWWMSILIPLLILLAVLLYLLLPKNVAVPELVGKEVFAAEESLTKVKLKLDPNQKEKVDAKAKPGTVISQTPKEGEKVEEGTPVVVQVAISPNTIEVPALEGKTFEEAEKLLREAELTRGQVDPVGAKPDFVVKSSLPPAKEIVNKGKPVDLFLVPPEKAKKDKAEAEAEGGPGGGGGEEAGGGGEGAADIVIPAVGKLDAEAMAQALAEKKLIPRQVNAFSDTAKTGVLFATDPPGGTKVAEGATVDMLVSAGFPLIAFDDGDNVLLVRGADGDREPAIAKSGAPEKDPTFTFDGSHVAYVRGQADQAGGDIMLFNRDKPDVKAFQISPEGAKFQDPTFAPTIDANVLAVNKVVGPNSNDLCFGEVGDKGVNPVCIKEDGFSTSRVIRWAPDGKSVYAFAVKAPGVFGMVEYTSKVAFSSEAGDWGKGEFITDNTTKDQGVLDMSFSPNGRQMVAVSNHEGGDFQLYITKPDDTGLQDAKPLGVQACKADWRADSREIVVVQGDCGKTVAQIVRLDPKNPKATPLKLGGDNPVYQPLLPETKK
jgi:beta-lactam-binding protein with PASTA domain